MGLASENRIKFNQVNLRGVEKRIDSGEFTRESYIYDTDSNLAIRVLPKRSYCENTFCMFARIRVSGESQSRMYKRQIMKVGAARNSKVPLSELRQKADSLFFDIQEGRDPKVLAQKKAEKLAMEQELVEAKRSFRDMIYGTPTGTEGVFLPDGFIAERRPGERYQKDIKNKCVALLNELLDEPLYSITPDQVKAAYLKRVGRGKTQMDGAMRMMRSIWNWAEAKYDDSDLFVKNPVSRAMKQLGININRTNRRNVRLDDSDFKPYLASVLNLKWHDHTAAFRNGRDSLLFMLFSGVRLTGTMSIRMCDLNLDKRTFEITKKGGDRAELPLNTVTEAIARNRLKHLPAEAEYLFPGIGNRGHAQDPNASRAIVKAETGINVTNHDLRRTYKSLGTELGINPVLIDELCCHQREGVDAHYIHPSMTSLRQASQQIADYIIEKAEADIVASLLERW